jgi:pimeloyl-ACP methyl ester carboxylesterase
VDPLGNRLVLIAAAAIVSGAWSPAATQGRPGVAVDTVLQVDGATIHARCVGNRLPGVLLLHGARSSRQVWDRVLAGWTSEHRLCAFDRPGHGRSGPAPTGRDWTAVANEIHAVRAALGLSGPWVVGGHSLGGLYARGLALGAEPPAAAVLVDPAHEDMRPRLRGLIPHSAWSAWGDELSRNGDGLDEIGFGDWLRGKSSGSVPLTVVSAVRRRFPPGWDAARAAAVARELHASLANGIGGRLLLAERSGHDVPNDQPELVRRAIVEALGAIERIPISPLSRADPAAFMP